MALTSRVSRILELAIVCFCLAARSSHGYCQPGWLSNISSSFCYYFVRNVSVSFANATLNCAAMGANLTYVDSEAENYNLYLTGPSSISQDFWISYKRYPGGLWRWPTGSRGTYLSGWDVTEPDGDGDCAKQTMWNNGRWRDWPCSLNLPYSCKKFAECGPPPALGHAELSMSGPTTTNGLTYPPGATATYTCQDGYEFQAGVTRTAITCAAGGGGWIGGDGRYVDFSEMSSCTIKQCDTPPTFNRASTNCSGGSVASCSTDLGTVISYACDFGYWFDPWSLGQSRTMTCNSNKEWDGLAVDCQKTYCNRPITGNARCDNPLSTVGTVATYICDIGYQFRDNRSRSQTFTCTETTWSPKPDKCEIIRCPYYKVKNALAITSTGEDITDDPDKFVYDTTVLFKCMTGNTYADTTVLKSTYCTENGNWTVNITEQCYPIQCTEAPPNVTGADVSPLYDLYYYGSNLSYTCQGDLKYSDGAKTRFSLCGKDGLWVPNNVGECISDMITIQPTRYHPPVVAKSAEVYGGVAIIILVVITVSIFVVDLLTIAKHLDRMRRNLNCAKKDNDAVGDAAAA